MLNFTEISLDIDGIIHLLNTISTAHWQYDQQQKIFHLIEGEPTIASIALLSSHGIPIKMSNMTIQEKDIHMEKLMMLKNAADFLPQVN